MPEGRDLNSALTGRRATESGGLSTLSTFPLVTSPAVLSVGEGNFVLQTNDASSQSGVLQ